MQTVQYRRWTPPSGSVTVEFSPAVLTTIQDSLPTTSHEESGLLLGVSLGNEIRLLEALGGDAAGEEIAEAGLAVVGIYSVRKHGEVFLTESDLARMERSRARIALVVASRKAGFFVRESDGTIQAIRSHEEFSLEEIAATLRNGSAVRLQSIQNDLNHAEPCNGASDPSILHASSQTAVPASTPRSGSLAPHAARGGRPFARRQTANRIAAKLLSQSKQIQKRLRQELAPLLRSPERHPLLPPPNRLRLAAVATACFLVPIACLAYLSPKLPARPIELTVEEMAGQLVIEWDAASLRKGGKLEISERGATTSVDIAPGATGATYAYYGGEVQVRVASGNQSGNTSWAGTRFVTPAPPSMQEAGRLRQQVENLREEVAELQATADASAQRMEHLKRTTEALLPRTVADSSER